MAWISATGASNNNKHTDVGNVNSLEVDSITNLDAGTSAALGLTGVSIPTKGNNYGVNGYTPINILKQAKNLKSSKSSKTAKTQVEKVQEVQEKAAQTTNDKDSSEKKTEDGGTEDGTDPKDPKTTVEVKNTDWGKVLTGVADGISAVSNVVLGVMALNQSKEMFEHNKNVDRANYVNNAKAYNMQVSNNANAYAQFGGDRTAYETKHRVNEKALG